MFNDRFIGKEDVVHIYNGILLSHKPEQNCSFVEMWMDTESVMSYGMK